ncbi:uncharacterized protein LOC142335485 [Convolutriloba macropyga]|uniref:uncharacterized protein LOC142335485 n=1 Tax=Convolutriloba macropyga TaxID=536237 RepID=UPI003F51B7E3
MTKGMGVKASMAVPASFLLLLTSHLIHAWQFPGADQSMLRREHKWVDARRLMGPKLSYSSLERDMKLINPQTFVYLRKYDCPERNYIEKMYIDVNTHNSYMIQIDCATGPHWFLYNGVMSGHVSLDKVYNRDPIAASAATQGDQGGSPGVRGIFRTK